MGCYRDSPNRKIESVGEISFIVISYGRSCSLYPHRPNPPTYRCIGFRKFARRETAAGRDLPLRLPVRPIGISAVVALERGRGSRGPAGADSPGSGVGGVG